MHSSSKLLQKLFQIFTCKFAQPGLQYCQYVSLQFWTLMFYFKHKTFHTLLLLFSVEFCFMCIKQRGNIIVWVLSNTCPSSLIFAVQASFIFLVSFAFSSFSFCFKNTNYSYFTFLNSRSSERLHPLPGFWKQHRSEKVSELIRWYPSVNDHSPGLWTRFRYHFYGDVLCGTFVDYVSNKLCLIYLPRVVCLIVCKYSEMWTDEFAR